MHAMNYCWVIRRALIDIFRQQAERRLDQDLHIQPHRPVVDVGEVELDAFLHLVQGFGFAAAAADLRQAGDAGLDAVAGHVGVDLAGVVVVVRHGVRARADQRHAALQHVDELRQFVDGGAADEAADGGNTVVVAGGLLDFLVVVHAHGAELPHLDDLAVPAVTLLLEDHRAGGGALDQQGDGQHQRAEGEQRQQGDDAVHRRLGEGGGGVGGQRAFVEMDGRQAIDVAD